MVLLSIDPRNGEVLGSFSKLDERAIDAKLSLAVQAFRQWRTVGYAERAKPMRQLAALLEAEKQKFGQLMTEEMGKTHTSAIAEVEKCALTCRHFAEHAERLLADEKIETEAKASFVRYLPLGPVLAIMPWNFPFWQVFRFLAPTLMAGNVGLLKHASNVPRCAQAIEGLLLQAGFPEGVFQSLLVGADQVPKILRDSRVAAATLTGSTQAGAAVASVAGEQIKPTVLELGGSDAFVVLPSADLDTAVREGVKSRILNNGQSCINAKRFIVHSAVYTEFEQKLVAAFELLKVGDPMNPEVDVGPLAQASGRAEVVSLVNASLQAGARRLTGAVAESGPGHWFCPGVLAAIPENAPVFYEEVFAPVALLFRVASLDAAIALANYSRYGLGSSVWTHDVAEQARLIQELETGQTFVNAMVVSDPRLPFGGVKASGYGRELGSLGIRAFTNAKTVCVASRGG